MGRNEKPVQKLNRSVCVYDGSQIAKQRKERWNRARLREMVGRTGTLQCLDADEGGRMKKGEGDKDKRMEKGEEKKRKSDRY